jgi:ribA/ribD-fused uncharacterized protein
MVQKAGCKMSKLSIADFIRENYPQYWGVQTYPAGECVAFTKVTDEWGLLCNFAHTPIVVEGVEFRSAEQLYQMMKFTDPEIIQRIWTGVTRAGKVCHEIKRTAKSYEPECRREDWPRILVDAMKFVLVQKYRQCPEFAALLSRSRGRYIVEDQTSFPKRSADAWGVKRVGDIYVGPNLLGRLLMQLRDADGRLAYQLPTNILRFTKSITTRRAE